MVGSLAVFRVCWLPSGAVLNVSIKIGGLFLSEHLKRFLPMNPNTQFDLTVSSSKFTRQLHYPVRVEVYNPQVLLIGTDGQCRFW